MDTVIVAMGENFVFVKRFAPVSRAIRKKYRFTET